MLRIVSCTAVLLAWLSTPALAQNASSVVSAAAQAMGAERLNSITYSGTARNGAFGQSKAIGDPMGTVNVTQINPYTRTINFQPPAEPTALVSRATGTTQPPAVPGVPPQPAGAFNQNITGAQASSSWAQAMNIWTTPWGFLKGAAANNATVRQEGGQQVVSFSPSTPRSPSGEAYVVTGYIDSQNLVTKVETRVDNAVVGDLPVEFEYSNYQDLGGVQVPTRIVQRQAGMPSFEASITAATPNPTNLAELLTLPPPPAGAAAGGGGAQATSGPPDIARIGDGVFKIAGNYTSLAIDMGDHVLVVEAGQSETRGRMMMRAARNAIPDKPIRYVVNSHPHFDHASGLAAVVAQGATILTHRNNEDVLERLLSGPRVLVGDSLAKVATAATSGLVSETQSAAMAQAIQGVGDRDVRTGTNGKVVELIHIPNEHSDGMLAVYLPAERLLWTADLTVVNPNPTQLAWLRSAVETFDRLGIDYETWLPTHPPSPNRALTRADVTAALNAPAP